MSINYRTRLLSGFLGLAIIASALVFFLNTRHAKKSIFEQIQSQLLSVAIEAAAAVDAEAHERIRSEADAGGEDYRQISLALRQVRDRNRREDISIAFIYTFRRVPPSADTWSYVVDAEESAERRSPVGEVIVWNGQGTPEDEPLQLSEPYCDERFVTDPYGSWLSAYAPVRDRSGSIVAMVGVDIAADFVIAKWDHLNRDSMFAFGIAIALAGILSIMLARIVSRPLAEISAAVRKIGAGHLGTRLDETPGDEFGEVARNINEMAQSLQERDALEGALSRYLPKDAARRLVEEQALPKLRGERREVTVLIGDIANLSELAEKLPPEKLVERLNEYFERMVEIIFNHNGTIDRLLGNRLIAVFGAPVEDGHKARNAVAAAIAMRQQHSELNHKWGLAGDQSFRLGVSVRTGSALLGNIGSRGNIEFTVVGSAVDIASLIAGENHHYKTDALICETTMNAVSDEFRFTEVGDIQPTGFSDFIRLYSVRDITTGAVPS